MANAEVAEASGATEAVHIIFIRHAPTSWNRAGRLQGRTDIPLDEDVRCERGVLLLPAAWQSALWYASPLQRAMQTAHLLSGHAPRIAPALIEMDWGTWEGQKLSALRERDASFTENENRGLDFMPPGGESPRDVCTRLATWLAELGAMASSSTRPIAAVTHKGVLRAALSLATGWDMRGEAPHTFGTDCAHHFVWRDARLSLVRANLPLWSGAAYR